MLSSDPEQAPRLKQAAAVRMVRMDRDFMAPPRSPDSPPCLIYLCAPGGTTRQPPHSPNIYIRSVKPNHRPRRGWGTASGKPRARESNLGIAVPVRRGRVAPPRFVPEVLLA